MPRNAPKATSGAIQKKACSAFPSSAIPVNWALTIEDIKGLLELSQHPDKPCQDADKIAVQRLSDVRARIAKLRRLERELKRITACQADNVASCAVIESLADHGLCDAEH